MTERITESDSISETKKKRAKQIATMRTELELPNVSLSITRADLTDLAGISYAALVREVLSPGHLQLQPDPNRPKRLLITTEGYAQLLQWTNRIKLQRG